jgi:hypothetical protein
VVLRVALYVFRVLFCMRSVCRSMSVRRVVPPFYYYIKYCNYCIIWLHFFVVPREPFMVQVMLYLPFLVVLLMALLMVRSRGYRRF